VLVLAGTLTIDPTGRDTVADAVRAITAATRKEPGCVGYRFSFDIDDDSLVHVFEAWEDEAVWLAHMQTPHVAAFGGAVGALMKDAALQRYEVSSAGPLTLPGQ
jgi:quinol monooxygenase YgiN